MKIGFDIHGVIDYDPRFFSKLSNKLIESGHEVHIITGSKKTKKVELQLKNLVINYTHFFSVSDCLIAKGYEVKYETSDNPWFQSDAWDRCKGEYCHDNIDIHFDDTLIYAEYFHDCVFVHCIKTNFNKHRFEVVHGEESFEKFKQFHYDFIENKCETI